MEPNRVGLTTDYDGEPSGAFGRSCAPLAIVVGPSSTGSLIQGPTEF